MSLNKNVQKPKTRSKARKFLGKNYFIVRRYIHWLFDKTRYSKKANSKLLPFQVFEHSSILLRPLKDVDMKYQYNKITNLRLAIDRIDKIVINPGETFSFWKLVGRPSKNKGYLKGLILNNGKIGYDYGGGLCQLGNLLYWTVLHSPLTVTERWRHGYDVFPDINRKLPFGSGATLSYNYIDFQFKNETSQPFQLHLWLTEDRLFGALLAEKSPEKAYEVYEESHQFRQEYWGGYTRHNVLRRKTFEQATENEISDEVVAENHAIMMYAPLIDK